jgi:RND family efflux transporter MFP subunit
MALRLLVLTLKTVLPLVALVAAFVIFQGMMATAPQATRRPPQHQARLVEVMTVERGADRVHVEARGVVRPAFEVTLTPQVIGEVIEMSEHLVPGGRFSQGDVLLRIDPRDYEYTVLQREGELTRSRATLTLEEGSQDVAQREYEVLGQELSEGDKTLVFRVPQLETAKAGIASAEAMLRDAKLDLERTTVTAPFDALVVTENVDQGSRLTTQSIIAHLVGTDIYWVELSVSQADLRWVLLPEEGMEGSEVLLRQPNVWAEGATREGKVVRLLPDLSEQGRMARLLVEVEDPLALLTENAGKPKLLIGQYLEAELLGQEVDSAFRIARAHLRDGEFVWVMNGENKLEVRPLEILFRGTEDVLAIAGVESGERIVTTDLATAAEGMPLRTAEQEPPTAPLVKDGAGA